MTRGPWQDSQRVECLVIDGGPMGRTAAIFLARYRLTVTALGSPPPKLRRWSDPTTHSSRTSI
jgi:thioredoxin reductase